MQLVKIIKKGKWFICRLFVKITAYTLSTLVKHQKNYIVFSAKCGKEDKFLHNTKYLFLYLYNKNSYHATWLCDDENMIKIFKQNGFNNVYKTYSIKGMYYALKSKYWFYDYFTSDLPNVLTANAILINLWHGTGGLKKSGQDDMHSRQMTSWQQKIYDNLTIKDTFFNVDGEHEIPFRKSAFNAKDEQIIVCGSPRLDVLYKDIPYADLFMDNDYFNIKTFKEKGKKLFFYTPTWRETKEDLSSWLKSDELQNLLKENNSVLVCKLHPFDNNSLDFKLSDEIYKMNNNSDIYPLLKYADGLISDYSSIYFDFLLIDKPIIYYVPDLAEYQEKCRGFYEPYEKLTAGEMAFNEKELFTALENVINGIDNHVEDRELLRDQTFKYQDGKNSERVIEWLRSMDK